MRSRKDAVAVIDRLHEAQARLYLDGDAGPVRSLLTDDIAWHVPGTSPIAGTYRGIDEVVRYMLARREAAGGTFRMYRVDVLSATGPTIAVLTDGTASIGGANRHWSTVGLYRLSETRVAECWLLPLDQAEFDDIWTPRPPD